MPGAERQLLIDAQLVTDGVELDGGEQRAVVVGQDPSRWPGGGVRTVGGQYAGGSVRGGVEVGLGEEADGCGQGGGDLGGVGGEVEQVRTRAEAGVGELDQGLESDPVGDGDPARGDALGGAARPVVQQAVAPRPARRVRWSG